MNRAERRANAKEARQRPTLTVRPNSTLSGRVFEMRKLTTREYLAIQRDQMDDVALTELTINAIRSHDLPGDPLDELDVDESIALMKAWLSAHAEDAVPEASGAD